MQVSEFLEVYPINSSVPPIKNGFLGEARRKAHIAGEATLRVIQGEMPTATQRSVIESADAYTIKYEFHERLTSREIEDESEFQHFGSCMLARYMFGQYGLGLLDNPNDKQFNYAYQSTISDLVLHGLSYAGQLESMRQDGMTIREISEEHGAGSAYAMLNEIEAAMILLGIAKVQRPGRNLVVLPAPPQVEWYKPDPQHKSKGNLHADLLLLDTTDPDNRKIAPVQVKSFATDKTTKQYDKSKVALICGRADLGNWTQEEGKGYTWPGRITIQRAGDLLLNNNNLMRAIKNGHISRQNALAYVAYYRPILEAIKHRNVNYKEIYAKLWPRLQRALDN